MMHTLNTLTRSAVTLGMLALLGSGSAARADDFLDLTSLAPGSSGAFKGLLGAINVNGAITTPTPGFQFDATGPLFPDSTTNNTSPQYSYSNIYTPSMAATDRVGYTSFSGSLNPATITLSFSSAVTNPTFHVANLDSMQYDFTPTAGLGGLVLLSGNNGGGDGILVSGAVISDGDLTTGVGQPPNAPPLTSGPRSAYGSVELLGTFSSLTINVSEPDLGGDGGSFTISTVSPNSVPEPGSIALLVGMITVGAGVVRRRRK